MPTAQVTLIGHPFVPIGMGEHLRATFRSLRAAGVAVKVRDVYKLGGDDPAMRAEIAPYLVDDFGELNLFCINGDEVESVLRHLGVDRPPDAGSIIYPLWELSHYPEVWAKQLERFSEVWSTSRFTSEALKNAVNKSVLHMPLAGELYLDRFFGRRHFGLTESSFVFLFFFDFSSYIQRKNPFSVLQAFDEFCKLCPDEDVRLLIKIKGGQGNHEGYGLFAEFVKAAGDRVVVIDKLLSDSEIKNLVRISDSFLSLHRAEGFGFGLISAMFLGKPVIATGYSGNCDFMSEDNSCLVRYQLTPVPPGAYPFWEDQVWAEPDVGHAVQYMERLVRDRDYGRALGAAARRSVRQGFSYRASGLRLRRRLEALGSLPFAGRVADNLDPLDVSAG